MEPFRTIVVATDFGPSSRKAVDLAAELAARLAAELVIVHSVEPFIPPYPVSLMPEPGTFERAAERELDSEVLRVRQVVPRVRRELLLGTAVDAITTFVHDRGADLLVVGTHGRRGPSRWMLGSVAERVARSSRVPVLTVRGE